MNTINKYALEKNVQENLVNIFNWTYEEIAKRVYKSLEDLGL